MAKITEIRLTLAAFFYGVEVDLKDQIKRYITPFNSDLEFFKDEKLVSRIIERYNLENNSFNAKNNIDDLIDYLDFYDSFNILKKNNAFLPKNVSSYLDVIFGILAELVPIRNRVMHTRPLLGGDFSTVYNFITGLKKTDPIDWKHSLEARNLIEKDPGYVLTLKIPTNSLYEKASKVIHNLPAPDFDDTGFIGRAKDVEDVKRLILSNKVVSIIGDGGIGKTALAVKVLYDIVDMGETCPFELVIWTSAKTTMLTSRGIEEIYSKIKDCTGLIFVISEPIGENNNQDKLKTILEYLDVFKTLIVIDNLETIQSEEVRDFIREAQTKCNILITSRIGLGELEYPRRLTGLSENESARLIREIASIRNSDILLKLPQQTLVDISSKLYFNPLAIKWFVNTVEMGISPTEVLNNKEILLDFCLTNVYEKLSNGAVSILNSIRASRRKLSTAEILYLSNDNALLAKQFLIELLKTTLVSREIINTGSTQEVYYYISDFAKEFLSKKYPIDADYVKKITEKSHKLTRGLEDIDKIHRFNKFSVNALSCDTSTQRIAAKLLSEALRYSKAGDFKSSLEKVNEAKNVDPGYFEVYRVSAFIKATTGDILGAEDDYKLGLEIAPNNVRLLYYYSQFLLFKLEDAKNALKYAEMVYKQEPNDPHTAFLFSRCYNGTNEYNKAIQIIKELIKNIELNPKNKRVAYTELISLYANTGRDYLRVESDISSGSGHYKKAFELFEFCVSKEILDYKLIKSFCEALYSFILLLPAIEIDANNEYVKNLILKFEKQIRLVHFGQKIVRKYCEKFNSESLSCMLEDVKDNDFSIGNIVKNSQETFVFIDSDGSKYFAHYSDFTGIKDLFEFKKISDGQLVSFQLGKNEKGVCAVNVKIIQ
jgi:LuxR family transcriptional regulator, glucitol operon activator